MNIKVLHLLLILTLFVKTVVAQKINNESQKLNLSELKLLGEVDKRFQSFNIEMAEVVGGDFWVPYNLLDSEKVKKEGFAALKHGVSPIDLYQKKLRTLAAALGPTYIRVSGTWANTTYFQDNDEPKLETAPKGFENVLTRAEWKGVIDFAKAVDAKVVTSFAISDGMRDQDGNWTPAQIQALLNYTKSIGGEIAAAEMFNEPSHASHGGAPKDYDASDYARDFAAFKSFVDKAVPEMKIMGPGSTGEGGIIPIDESMSTDKILTASPKPDFDIFSYHFYGGVSQRCRGGLTPENALSEEWLSRTELGLKFYEEARDKYLPGAPIWLTETAEAACGGNPWAATYLDSFRYLEQLGRLAKKGVQVVMHNTLAVSEYGLLDQKTLEPRPNYWSALLWNKLMGTKVYESDLQVEGLDVFVHDLKSSSKGYAVLIVNPTDAESSIEIPSNAEQYLLTASGDDLLTKTVKLNGDVLELTSADTLPEIKGKKINAGQVQVPPNSILFLAFPN
jgi:heparanase 1